ncbi:hypothetical protein NPIL_591121 [Nephila pilipes]|uniref:Uncharacterized protein n=1 Tax=Nephila pilipes TaxID=299642 RepID=A0A8X6QSB5_NEPPI|nr:hypothetical protein NPIL_591121 [Nephila pilipes]
MQKDFERILLTQRHFSHRYTIKFKEYFDSKCASVSWNDSVAERELPSILILLLLPDVATEGKAFSISFAITFFHRMRLYHLHYQNGFQCSLGELSLQNNDTKPFPENSSSSLIQVIEWIVLIWTENKETHNSLSTTLYLSKN